MQDFGAIRALPAPIARLPVHGRDKAVPRAHTSQTIRARDGPLLWNDSSTRIVLVVAGAALGVKLCFGGSTWPHDRLRARRAVAARRCAYRWEGSRMRPRR